MTLRIQTEVEADRRTIRLIGHLEVENLAELALLVEEQAGHVALDLEELDLVDLAGIRFLAQCDRRGVPLVNCPPYVRSWIAQEQRRDET